MNYRGAKSKGFDVRMSKTVTLEPERVAQPPGGRASIVDSLLPASMQERLASLFPDDEPETLDEWTQTLVDEIEFEGDRLTLDDLDASGVSAAEEPVAHVTTIGDETFESCCVEDSLLASFIVDDPVETTAECPTTGTEVSVTVNRRGSVEAAPAEAVVSFGVSSGDAGSGGTQYDQQCPQVALFASEGAYEEWAAGQDDVTVALPVDEAFEVAEDAFQKAERKAVDQGSSSSWDCRCC